jgi:N-acetylglucosamine-6-phosphate deacetylase
MIKAVRNCVEKVGIPLEEAIRMASVYPAEVINISDRGRIAPGCKADMIIFDGDYNIEHVFIEGVKV